MLDASKQVALTNTGDVLAEALVLHFIDDLDSKLNQFRNLREAGTGIVYQKGLGRFVYLPPDQPLITAASVLTGAQPENGDGGGEAVMEVVAAPQNRLLFE